MSCGACFVKTLEKNDSVIKRVDCKYFVFTFNTFRPRQNGRHFADDFFKCIFRNENAWIPIKISLKFVPWNPIYNIPALVQILAWRRPGDKPLSEPMMVNLTTHIYVTRPQWVNSNWASPWSGSWATGEVMPAQWLLMPWLQEVSSHSIEYAE